jgi:hypothetical protein
MKTLSYSTALLTLWALLGFGAFAQAATSPTIDLTLSQRKGNGWTWKWQTGKWSLQFKSEGKFEFTDDYQDFENISPDGFVEIREEHGRQVTTIKIVPNPDGSLNRSYFVQKKSAPFDGEAKAWLGKVLLEAVRKGGLDADKRAQRIFQKQGLKGVIEEIALLQNDFVKQLYFSSLLKNGKLDSEQIAEVVGRIPGEIQSDFEKTRTLTSIPMTQLANQNVGLSYTRVASTIASDFEKARALAALIEQQSLNPDTMTRALAVGREIQSDFEKSRFLIAVLEKKPKRDVVTTNFVAVLETIHSDFEQRRVMSAALKRNQLPVDTLHLLVKSTEGIRSDFEKASVLIELAPLCRSEESLQRELVEAAKTIASDFERGRVLATIYKKDRARR